MRQRIAGLAVILAVATWVVYQPSIRAPFLFDDVVATVENPTIRDLGRIAEVLSPPGSPCSRPATRRLRFRPTCTPSS